MKDLRTKRLEARPTHGMFVPADPPEAGWRLKIRSNAEATADAEMLAVPAYAPPGCLGADGQS
jgi:hypothetical protein